MTAAITCNLSMLGSKRPKAKVGRLRRARQSSQQELALSVGVVIPSVAAAAARQSARLSFGGGGERQVEDGVVVVEAALRLQLVRGARQCAVPLVPQAEHHRLQP